MELRNYSKEDEIEVKDIFKQYWTDNKFLDELSSELDSDKCKFYVAEENNEIVGIAGLRQASKHLNNYADTEKPAELYIIASKHKNKGIGNLLGQKIIEEAKNLKYTEIVCYSPETHSDSWRFYENLDFIKHGTINDQDDGYPGMLWKKII